MSRLAEIKAKQFAEAMETGEMPYAIAPTISVSKEHIDADEALSGPAVTRSKLAKIKYQQLQAAEKSGINPYTPPRAADSAPAAAHGSLDHYQAAMDADLGSLSALTKLEDKAAAKKTMIETYWGFIKAYMDNGDNYPNSVAVRVMIWLFDVLDIERALDLAFYLIKTGVQVTPSKFDRDIPTFVCDAVYDWANALLKMDPPQSASPYLDALVATLDNDKWSLAPPVQSKMYAMLAKHKNRVGEYALTVSLCEKAEQVNPEGHGTKGLKAGALAKLKEQPKDV